MSVVAPAARKPWLAILIAAGVIAGAALVALVARDVDHAPATGPSDRAVPSVAAPAAEHARWRIHSRPSGGGGKLTKADLRRVKASGAKLKGLLTSIYDGLFLESGRVSTLLDHDFSRGAARSFRRSSVGLPKAAGDVVIVRRDARIAIDARRARRAAASVDVVLKGKVEDAKFRIRHDATLWLERSSGRGWKVIAFDVAQRRLK